MTKTKGKSSKKTKKEPKNLVPENKKKERFNPLKMHSYMDFRIFLVLLFIVYIVSAYARVQQYHHWRQHKALYFVGPYPAMTTLDAYHWLRYAKDYKNGTYIPGGKDRLVAYPDGGTYPKPVPMLSYMIAKLSSLIHAPIYYSGLYLVPVLGALFVIPLGLYLYFCDMPVAGLAAGFIGNFSWMYYIRTSMGRVDTDLLQLFFLFIAALFVLLIYKTESQKKTYIYATLAGVFLALFVWWYDRYGVILIYMVILAFLMLVKRRKLTTIAVAVFLLALFANPLNTIHGVNSIIGFLSHYFVVKKVSSGGFPNIMNTITETEHLADSRVLMYILSSKFLDYLGIVLLIVAMVFLRLRSLALLPTLALGITAFTGANRAIMFFAPFVGLGLGFVIDYLASYLHFKKIHRALAPSAAIVLGFILLFGVSSYSAIKFTPLPSIPPDIVRSFINMKEKIKKASVVTWWDFGYAIQDIDGYATYHDGGAHGGARTYLIARAFSCDNQTELYHIISYIDHFGVKSIDRKIRNGEKTVDVIKEIVAYSKPIKHKTNYLLFTRDMISKFGAISYLGTWNFKQKKSHPMLYQFLTCYRFTGDKLYCSGNVFDLKNGMIDNKIRLKRIVIVSNGYTLSNKKFANKGYTLELLLKNKTLIYALLCNDRVYKTTFNQIYLLGNYDRKYFKEVYNNFPSARMFKFK